MKKENYFLRAVLVVVTIIGLNAVVIAFASGDCEKKRVVERKECYQKSCRGDNEKKTVGNCYCRKEKFQEKNFAEKHFSEKECSHCFSRVLFFFIVCQFIFMFSWAVLKN